MTSLCEHYSQICPAFPQRPLPVTKEALGDRKFGPGIGLHSCHMGLRERGLVQLEYQFRQWLFPVSPPSASPLPGPPPPFRGR